MDPPRIELSYKSSLYEATVSVRYPFTSSKSHAKKADAQEDAACQALANLCLENVDSQKQCRSRLNEYCQQWQSGKPDYVPSDDGPPFNCTVYVPVTSKSQDVGTESAAKNDASRAILSKLGHSSHILQLFDCRRFESFDVSEGPVSLFRLTARYRFPVPAEVV